MTTQTARRLPSATSTRWGPAHWPWTHTAVRLLLAAAGGGAMFISFPPTALWGAAPVGVALVVAAVWGCGIGQALLYGYAAGLAFFLPLLPWVGIYVGAGPWIALAAVEAVAVAVFGALVSRMVVLPGYPLWCACAWTATEALRSRLPFGGFPWGKLAFGQTDGPLVQLAAVGGAPAVSFAVALIGCSGFAVVRAALRRSPRAAVRASLGGILPFAGAALLIALPAYEPRASVTVAVIQGNVPRLGLDFNAQRAAVLENHLRRTEDLASAIESGQMPRPAMIVWPENASDIDPLRDRQVRARIDETVNRLGVPVLVGAVLSADDGTSRNVSIVWNPGSGPGQQHIKRRLVPFGEYLPMRPVATRLSAYADKAGRFVPGDGDGIVTLAGIPTAAAICYEVAFDDLIRESVRGGAQLITVPTNNATFGRTAMSFQQLAMSRLRAIEHRRTVLIAATSGVSAVVTPDGTVTDQSALFSADTLIATVPLDDRLTLATRWGALPEAITSALAAAALIAATVFKRRARRTSGLKQSVPADTTPVPIDEQKSP